MKKFGALIASLAIGIASFAPMSYAQDKGMVGISMPTKTSTRWISDGETMEKLFTEAGYTPDLQFADDDIPNQLAQIENMITKGAKVLVIASIDGTTLSKALQNAADKGVKVIAYDRLIKGSKNVDYYATFDNFQVGVLQALSELQRSCDAQAGNPFDVICGTSAGAINAVGLAAGAQHFRRTTAHLVKMWQSVRVEDVYRVDAPYFIKAFLQWGGSLLTGGKLAAAMKFQVGATAAEAYTFNASADLTAIGTANTALIAGDLSIADPSAVIALADTAVAAVGTLRSSIGAGANRLNHISNNLANVNNNTQIAKSRIMDTDYANETANMTSRQMLMQAGTSMLKQSGSIGQLAMSLMQ